jgi:5'-nucleotidase
MRRICVDMDEVMADTLAEHLRRYNQAFAEEITTD